MAAVDVYDNQIANNGKYEKRGSGHVYDVVDSFYEPSLQGS